ncbi:hypothetical protein PMAYCL1PPCAC_08365, partial [Pristionchus mayeri]
VYFHLKPWIVVFGMVIPLVLSNSVLVVTYFILKCDHYLDVSEWGYVFTKDARCVNFRKDTSVSRYVVMLILIGILDAASVIKVKLV